MNKYLLLVIALFSILLCSAAEANSGSWEVVGGGAASDGAASNPALFIYKGTPYLAYSNKYDRVYVLKFDGQFWQELGSVDLSGLYMKRPVLYVENGIPYIGIPRWSNSSNKATVMKYNVSSWEALSDAGITDEGSEVLSIYVDKGVPYLAYKDYANKLSVVKFNGNSWQKVGDFADDKTNWATLTISNGIPYIAYQNLNADNKGMVKRFINNKWQMVGNSIDMDMWSSYVFSFKKNYSDTYYSGLSLFMDNDTPYVLFTNSKKKASSVLLKDVVYYDVFSRPRAVVMKLKGSSWETLGNVGFSAGNTGYNDGQVDQWSFYVNKGVPYVAYCDPNKKNSITVKKFLKGQWLPVGPAGFTTEQAENPSLQFNNDVPYVAFINAKNSGRVTVMKYTGQLAKETSIIDVKKLARDAVVDMEKGYYKDAIYKFDQAIDMDPDRSNLYALRGQCYEQLKDYPSAISNFGTAIGLDPENWAAHYEKAICYFLNKEYHMTLSQENLLISLNINTPEAYAYRAYSYYRLKEYGKAWEELKKAQELGAEVEPSFVEMLKTDSGGEPKMFFFF